VQILAAKNSKTYVATCGSTAETIQEIVSTVKEPEKRKRGRPAGSTNKKKDSTTDNNFTTPYKNRLRKQ